MRDMQKSHDRYRNCHGFFCSNLKHSCSDKSNLFIIDSYTSNHKSIVTSYPVLEKYHILIKLQKQNAQK